MCFSVKDLGSYSDYCNVNNLLIFRKKLHPAGSGEP